MAWTCWLAASERQIRRIRYILFENILRQEISYFDVHSSGTLLTSLTDDMGIVEFIISNIFFFFFLILDEY